MKRLIEGLELGEGCLWDEKNQVIYMVDIEGFRIYAQDYPGGEIRFFDMGDYIGTIVLTPEGNLLAALHDRLVLLDPKTGDTEDLAIIHFDKRLRFNDGKCDPFGNLWVGTMFIDQDHDEAVGGGKLYCIQKNKVIAEYEGFTIPNGMAWNEERGVFYHIDTPTRQVFAYDYDEDGLLKNKRTAVTVDSEDGHPDGMTMDEEGNLWVAMWGGSKICVYDPETGDKIRDYETPDCHTSCCTFGGRDLETLFITSAKEEAHLGGLHLDVPGDAKGRLAYRYKM